MGYVSDIRKKVGHDEILIAGASVVVLKDGKTLLQRRVDNGLWDKHGGCVELGERVEDAARRELEEETGLIADRLTLLGVYSGGDLRYTYPNGDRVSVVDVCFVCESFHGECKPQDDEVSALKWFALTDLPSDLDPLCRRPLADAARRAT